ncbi:MAG: hypothetical protein ACRDJM_05925 [Actinomycetota bacterium]
MIAAYLVGAAISGQLSPLARLPLLDGVHAPPYRWVTPPPQQAPTNQRPEPASESLALSRTGTPQKIVTTLDQQASLSLPASAIKAATGRRGVEAKIEPLDPASLGGQAPSKLSFFGNAYRVALRYVPGGAAVGQLQPAGTLTLVYPAPAPSQIGITPQMLYSTDGRDWRKVESTVQHATQQLSTPVNDIGYFAIAMPAAAAARKAGKSFPWIVIVVVVGGVGLVTGTGYRIARTRQEHRRKAERRQALIRQSRSTKKRRR